MLSQNSLEILESGTEKQDLRGKFLKKYIYLQKKKRQKIINDLRLRS